MFVEQYGAGDPRNPHMVDAVMDHVSLAMSGTKQTEIRAPYGRPSAGVIATGPRWCQLEPCRHIFIVGIGLFELGINRHQRRQHRPIQSAIGSRGVLNLRASCIPALLDQGVGVEGLADFTLRHGVFPSG